MGTAFSFGEIVRCFEKGHFTDCQKTACPWAGEWYERECSSFRLSVRRVEILGFFGSAQPHGNLSLTHQITRLRDGR